MSCYSNSSCLAPSSGEAGSTFATALQYFAALQCLLPRAELPREADVTAGQRFDFIIIGGGSAGCVVANRLSEIGQWNILLVEAGADPPIESTIPNLDKGVFSTKYDWQYYTQNDGRSSQGIENGRVYWPRGKMVGGSSNINNMLYFKGSHCDYRSWYNEGNTEWRPDIVRKYFKKAESLQSMALLNDDRVNNEYGHDGPLAVNQFNSTFRDLTLNVLDAYNEIGFKNVADLNAANLLGSGLIRGNAANGRRADAASSYLSPIKDRKNLFIIKNALVIKVIINNFNKVAIGIKIEKNGKKQNFFADKEVVICAGSINTPQLLMLSGIGPQAHLRYHNIEVIADSPEVGNNLRDHFSVPITVYANQPGYEDEGETNFETVKYIFNQTGYLAQNSITDVAAFYSLNKFATFPDFQIHLQIFNRNSSTTGKYLKKITHFKPEARESVLRQNVDAALHVFLFNLLHPLSKGNITLSSNNAREHPLIYANYFSDETDLVKTAEGIKVLTKVVRSKFYKSIDGKLGRIELSPCNDLELDSLEYWKCIAKNFVTTIYHPIGTARMGQDPSTSVVDSRLRVHNVKNLRVIDASVMPTPVSSNTNGPVIMIGERGADLIKEDHKVI